MDRNLRLSRQAALMPSPRHNSVCIIGAGGIGSNALHLVASMGFEDITVVDPDVVGEENIYPGFFLEVDIGIQKSTTLVDAMLDMYDLDITGIYGTHEEIPADRIYDIIIVGTDTLHSRQAIWQEVAQGSCRGLYIDGRMGAHLATVYGVDMRERHYAKAYHHDLFLDDIEGELACGEKATAPLTKGFIPGMIGRAIFEFVNKRPVPFMQRIDLRHGYFINAMPMDDKIVRGNK